MRMNACGAGGVTLSYRARLTLLRSGAENGGPAPDRSSSVTLAFAEVKVSTFDATMPSLVGQLRLTSLAVVSDATER